MDYDSLNIRPELRNEDICMRGQGMTSSRLRAIKNGLREFHTLELMAVTIYRFQITNKANELNRQLIAAMCNEMTHYQDYQIRLYEYGINPSPLRLAYWFVGLALGIFSRLGGRKSILKTGIWAENKAVQRYDELLENIDWDDYTRSVIEKDRSDEQSHINRWKSFLQSDKQ